MAYLQGLYIHVTDEHVNHNIEVTDHPVEKGANISDHVQIKGKTLSLSGKIVGANGQSGYDILRQIVSFKDTKTLLKYEGRNVENNLIIASFNTSHPNRVTGGCEFDMELRQLRIADNAYVADEKKEAETVTEKPSAVKLAVGAIVVFKGGPVYVSSDAKQKAATRGRSTCKVTKISRANWSIHQIHLISTDGGKVYGWVDEKNIEAVNSASTVTKTNTMAGTQQITTG